MTPHKWHETHDNLVGLARWLTDICDIHYYASELIEYFYAPWKCDREYELWQLWKELDSAEWRERCIEAVDDDRVTAAQIRAEMEEAGFSA